MTRKFANRLRRLALLASGGIALALFVGVAWCQEVPAPKAPAAPPAAPPADNVPDPKEPAKPDAPPADPDAPPVDPGTRPARPGAQPTRPGTEPADPNAPPVDPGTRPARPGAQPTRPGAEPADPNAPAVDPGTRPARPGAQPTRPGTTPATPGARTDVRSRVEGAAGARTDIRGGAQTNIDARTNVNANVNLQSLRSADIGLWFDTSVRGRGLVISDIGTTGFIAKAGFMAGDTIVSVNGVAIADERLFVRTLFAPTLLRQRVPIVVLRGGERVTLYVEPQVLIQEMQATSFDPLEQYGVVLDDRYPDQIRIWRVLPRSPAFYAGVRSGDLITSFNGQAVATSQELIQLSGQASTGPVTLGVMRGENAREFALELQAGAKAGAQVGAEGGAQVGAEGGAQVGAQGGARTAYRPNLDETMTDQGAPSMPGYAPAPVNDYGPRTVYRRGLFRWRR